MIHQVKQALHKLMTLFVVKHIRTFQKPLYRIPYATNRMMNYDILEDQTIDIDSITI